MDKPNEIKINLKLLLGNLVMLIGIIAFVMLFSKFFGEENTLVGVAVITAMLMFKSINISLKCREAILAIIFSFIYMGLASYISRLNAFIGIPINFILVFIVIYLFTNEMKTKAYLPFILCYVFLEGNPISSDQLMSRIIGLLVGSILIAFIYYTSHKNSDDKNHLTVSEMISTIKTNSLQFNFALRMAIGLTIAMFIGVTFDFSKSMWISITVMSLTQPHYYQTKERIKQRIVGTMIGSILFLVLFEFLVPPKSSYLVLLIISYVYTFIKKYPMQIIFVTLNSLGAAMLLFDTFVSIPMRITFVLVGAVIAFMVNKIIYASYASIETITMPEKIL